MNGQPAERRKRSRTFVLVGLMLLLILIAIWLLIGHKAPQAAAAAPPKVGVAVAVREDMPLVLSLIGTVQPTVSATVRAQLSGTIFAIEVSEGQYVRKGQQLARIDPRPYQLALAQAQGTLARDLAQLSVARLDLQRYQRLLQEDSIARQQVDTQTAAVQQLTGTVDADKAAVGAARLNLEYTNLSAPVDGRVGLRRIDLGNYVTPADPNGVFVVTKDDPIDVSFAVPQDQIGRLLLPQLSGTRVLAFDQAGGTMLATGRLLAIDNQADGTSGTVAAKARFANASRRLFPSQFVSVSIDLGAMRDVVTVSIDAIRHANDADFIFVLRPSGKVRIRKVTLGPSARGRAAVLSGLKAGETVITQGADNLDEGMVVEPLHEGKSGGSKHQ